MNGKLSSHNEPIDIKSLLDVVLFFLLGKNLHIAWSVLKSQALKLKIYKQIQQFLIQLISREHFYISTCIISNSKQLREN